MTTNRMDAVSRVVDEFRRGVTGELMGQKEHAAEGLARVGRNIAGLSEDFERDNLLLAIAVQAVSLGLLRVASRLRERPVPELAAHVVQAARRQPVLFVGGALLAGFALSRLLRQLEQPSLQGVLPSPSPVPEGS